MNDTYTSILFKKSHHFKRSHVIFSAILNYRQTSNIRNTIEGNDLFDHSDVVGALPVSAAPTTSSCSTWHLASMDWAKTTARREENNFIFCDLVCLILEILRYASQYINVIQDYWQSKSLWENMSNFSVGTVPLDGLAPSGAQCWPNSDLV